MASANNWDIDYLTAKMPGNYTVILSDDHRFMYYDEKKLETFPDFTPTTRRVQMKFSEFAEKVRSWKQNEERFFSIIVVLFTLPYFFRQIFYFMHRFGSFFTDCISSKYWIALSV